VEKGGRGRWAGWGRGRWNRNWWEGGCECAAAVSVCRGFLRLISLSDFSSWLRRVLLRGGRGKERGRGRGRGFLEFKDGRRERDIRKSRVVGGFLKPVAERSRGSGTGKNQINGYRPNASLVLFSKKLCSPRTTVYSKTKDRTRNLGI